jgi:site-specific DNA-methyltransferase (adenine-specific)
MSASHPAQRSGVPSRVSPPRKPTATSSFGVSRREAHDATDFYARFTPPELSADTTVNRQPIVDEIFCLDARRMDEGRERIKPNSVALVVTSPPYFAGKAYEADLELEGVPASYLEYLQMLEDVFAACVDKLEPGGRIAVNVANLGRKPYRSLSADVIGILQDRLGLLLRGEIIWRKGGGTSGSCAWGSFQSAANPVLRDLTERVIVASKGRFDRAISRPHRADAGLPVENSMFKDDFMSATTDLWDLPPESATRVGHPAPFPVLLPQRLIELYTSRDDVVLDPFMGSGSTAIAALRTERRYLGFDTDRNYVTAANERIAAERARLDAAGETERSSLRLGVARAPEPTDAGEAIRAGEKLASIALHLLAAAGFTDNADDARLPSGLGKGNTARDGQDRTWHVEISGSLTTPRVGLRRNDVMWRTLGRATVLRDALPDARLIVATTDLPTGNGSAARTWAASAAGLVRATVDVLDPAAADQLRRLADEPCDA